MTKYLSYTLTLESPALLTSMEGDPNSSRSMPYIPGSAMRGVAAGLLDAEAADFRKLILSGEVCWLNVYPVADGKRSLPVPLSWKKEKYNDKLFHDLASCQNAADLPKEQIRPTGFEFIEESSKTFGVKVPRGYRVHNQRDRNKGRPMGDTDTEKGIGALFLYEPLEAGQTFAGLIAVPDDDAATRIKELLPENKTICIGRSRSAGYGGRMKIKWRENLTDDEIPCSITELKKDEECAVLLTSDYIGRDSATGQYDPLAIKEELKSIGLEVDRTCHAFKMIGGFNRKWKTELPQTPALAAGSVLVVKASNDIPVLIKIARKSLGLRRAEGFGRFTFIAITRNPAITKWTPADEPPEKQEMPSPDTDEGKALLNIQKRLRQDALEREIGWKAVELASSVEKKNLPPSSLIGRLREPLRMGDEKGLDHAIALVNSLSERARKKIEDCKIEGQPVHEWLRTGINKKNVGEDFKDIITTYTLVPTENADLNRWYRWRLADQTLAMLSAKARQENKDAATGGKHS